MSEISMYEAQKKKMEGLCEEHDLTYRFQKDTYPPTFTISPIQGMDAQLSMLENVEEAGYISPEAKMTWIFKDGSLETKVTGGTFTIAKTLRTKIESVLTKMLTYWMQYFFRDVMEKRSLKDGMMPVINEDEVEDDDAYEEDPEDPDDAEGPLKCSTAMTQRMTRTLISATPPTAPMPRTMISTIRLSASCAWKTRRRFLSCSAA